MSELITKLEAERNELQEQLERADEKEAEVTKQVFYLLLIAELCTVQYSTVHTSFETFISTFFCCCKNRYPVPFSSYRCL